MRSLVILLVFLSFLVPIGVFAYKTPVDLLKIEKRPPIDSRLVYKFQLDPKLPKEEKASILALWGGIDAYRTCVKLSKEERIVYLAKLKGVVEGASMVTEVSGTETFGKKFEAIDLDSSKLDKAASKSQEVTKIADVLRSKNLVK